MSVRPCVHPSVDGWAGCEHFFLSITTKSMLVSVCVAWRLVRVVPRSFVPIVQPVTGTQTLNESHSLGGSQQRDRERFLHGALRQAGSHCFIFFTRSPFRPPRSCTQRTALVCVLWWLCVLCCVHDRCLFFCRQPAEAAELAPAVRQSSNDEWNGPP